MDIRPDVRWQRLQSALRGGNGKEAEQHGAETRSSAGSHADEQGSGSTPPTTAISTTRKLEVARPPREQRSSQRTQATRTAPALQDNARPQWLHPDRHVPGTSPKRRSSSDCLRGDPLRTVIWLRLQRGDHLLGLRPSEGLRLYCRREAPALVYTRESGCMHPTLSSTE